jgi:hypothetical protein
MDVPRGLDAFLDRNLGMALETCPTLRLQRAHGQLRISVRVTRVARVARVLGLFNLEQVRCERRGKSARMTCFLTLAHPLSLLHYDLSDFQQ